MAQSAAYEQEERRSKKLAQVRKLLAKADGNTTSEEAESLRAKADQLMAAFAISEFEVVGHQDDTRRDPISRPVNFDWYWDHPQGEDGLWPLMLAVARHCRCKVVWWVGANYNARTGEHELPVVGMPADLDYMDMLFTSLWQQMSDGLEPKPDPKLPMLENLVRMKEAGMKWQRIADLLAQAGQLPEHTVGASPHKLNLSTRYTEYCKVTHRPRLRTTPSVYQRSYVEGFVLEVNQRFRKQREVKPEDPKNVEQLIDSAYGVSSSQALVLRDIAQAAQDKAYELFGRPRLGGRGRQDNRKRDAAANLTGKAAGARADLSGAKGRGQVGRAKKELKR